MYPDFDYTYADTITNTPFYDPFFNPESSYVGGANTPKFAEAPAPSATEEQHYSGIFGWSPGMAIAEGRKTMQFVVFGVIGIIVLIAVLIAIMTFLK